MVIKSIEINNFLSYHKENLFEFSGGATIIIGQNNTGKSKLFDAFNWVLYDKAFKTRDEIWADTGTWKDELVNNYSKSLCKNDEAVKSTVVVHFSDGSNNDFKLAREYKIKKKDNLWECPRTSTVVLTKRDALTNNSTDYFDIEAEDIIKTLFPENLSRYFLFQGENISQIMSLNNKSAFTRALRDLSRIEIFEKAKFYSEKVYRQAKKEFEAKEDSDKQIQIKKIEISSQLEKLKVELTDEQETFTNYCNERDTAKEVFDKKNNDLKKYEECAKILDEIGYLESQKESKIENRNNLIEAQKRDVFDRWMYAGTQDILKSFLTIYNKSKIEKKIPEPIRQDFVKEMLDKKTCLVCGGDAPEQSKAFINIKALLNEKSLDKEVEIINQLGYMADVTLEKVLNIKTEISEFYRRIENVDEALKRFQSKIKIKEDELKNVLPNDVTQDEVKQRDFQQLQKDRDTARSDLDKFEMKINTAKSRIDYITKLISDKQKEYDSLVDSSSNFKERERLKLAEKINDTTSSFYDSFLTKLIGDIETESNEYFNKMTKRNSALSGSVRVDFDIKEVYTVDESLNRLQNINQANKVSLQISFVAAVLSVSNKFWSTYFPFIADAPISALGGNNKITAIETMINIFNQSIIILKDDSVTTDIDSLKNDLVRGLIKNSDKVAHAYELKMSGDTIEQQNTTVVKLK